MAECVRFVCQHCGSTIDSWDEGNPYFIDDSGNKRYAYHPQPERELCIGVESPHLCLNCGQRFTADSRAPITSCPACDSLEITSTFDLADRICPDCKLGVFRLDPQFRCIS